MIFDYKIKACAKINLSLDIMGKRGDGYHFLSMVNQSVNLYDYLYFSKSDMPSVICTDNILSGENNLAFKAMELFKSVVPECSYYKINIEKNIPCEAGLGGGSADAAGVLRVLNKSCGEPFNISELCKLGEKLGADVPFCIFGGTAMAEGIGEKLKHLKNIPQCWFLVCKPSFGISTKTAFEKSDKSTVNTDYTQKVIEGVENSDIKMISKNLGNRFKDILNLQPLNNIISTLINNGAMGASLSGSGSAVFGIFDSEYTARKCYDKMQNKNNLCFVCQPSEKSIIIE